MLRPELQVAHDIGHPVNQASGLFSVYLVQICPLLLFDSLFRKFFQGGYQLKKSVQSIRFQTALASSEALQRNIFAAVTAGGADAQTPAGQLDPTHLNGP